MAVTSQMLPLGTEAPAFELPDAHGTLHRTDDLGDPPALVVMFICNHCPYVVHIARELALVTQKLAGRDVAVIGINANDADQYPADDPDNMIEMARTHGWDFPYLIDADQSVAKAYRAACTPDFYVFDGDRRLVYRGQFDAARPSNDAPVTGRDLVAAVNAVLAGEPVPEDQTPSMGCSIKWTPGNEPEWAS